MRELLRKNILNLKPYVSARSLKTKGEIFLDANEGPAELIKGISCSRYPEPQPEELLELLGEYYGVNSENMLMARGSDEIIDLIYKMYCEPGYDQVIINPPTYGMYKVCADIAGVEVVEIPMLPKKNSFELDNPSIVSNTDRYTKCVFICSPNNPTGGVIEVAQLVDLLDRLGERCMVVVDEAYEEFSSGSGAISLLPRYKNLIVLRTLSKAFGLAGLRIGIAVAQQEVIEVMRKVIAPYPIATPVAEMAKKFLLQGGIENMLEQNQKTCQIRDQFAKDLSELKITQQVFTSQSNFLLVRLSNAKKVMQDVLSKGIVLRDFSHLPQLENCLRISIGDPDQMCRLYGILKNISETV